MATRDIEQQLQLLPKHKKDRILGLKYMRLDGTIRKWDGKHLRPVCKKCNKQPNYNMPGQTTGLYCAAHKLDDMINVLSKQCMEPGCPTQPFYNMPGQTTGLYCAAHKLDDMIDVIHKRCMEPGCPTQPSYNMPGQTIRLYCLVHKLDDMIDVKHKMCPNCENWIDSQQGNPKYDGYCVRCFVNVFPNDPRCKKTRSKTKEIKVRNMINDNFDGFIHDKILYTGNCDCTHRRRIDHRIQIGNTMLAIETDEFGHRSYDKNDEEIRYNDVTMIFTGKWIWIRFNPDSNYDKTNFDEKLIELRNQIHYQMNRIKNEENTELIEIIKMYY